MITSLLDSNIYGKIVEEKEKGFALADKIKADPNFLIHNFKLIRNELRKAPKILPVYDKLVTNKAINETREIKNLADLYFKQYKENKGVQSRKNILNDFKIVACATILNCDLVVSNDKRTMMNPTAINAYKYVNIRINKRTPTFYTYKDIEKRYF